MLYNFDAITIGSAKIDAFLSIHEAKTHLRFNKDTNELCVKSGEKIAVDKCAFLLGGNATNVAVGLSRLGYSSSICAEIGDDEFSQKIISSLKKEGVNTDFLKQSKGEACSFSVILNFKGERTIFSEHVRRKHDFVLDNISAKWVYLTSIGEEWKDAYQKAVEFVKQTKCKLAFNPGTLQINAGVTNIADILTATNILFVNKEEAAQIVNYELRIMNQGQNKEEIRRLLEMLHKLGTKIVVITDGENGSYAIDEKGEMFMHGTVSCKIVEKTGAGDAYSTGFLAATLHGLSIKDAMRWGALNSASVIEKVGAQAGLLHKNDMEKKLNG